MKDSMGRFVLPLLGLCMGGLGLYHVHQGSQSAPLTAPLENPARAPFEHAVAGSGVVEAQPENSGLGVALPGLALEDYVSSRSAGKYEQPGTPLFRVDDRHLKAQLAVAKADLPPAKARLTRLER